MLETLLNIIPNVLLAASLTGLGVFGFTYARNANWRKTAPGRGLMYMIAAMALVLVLNFIHLIVAPYPGIEFVRIAAYTALTVTIWTMVRTLYRILKIDPFFIFRILRKPKKVWFKKK